MHYIDISRILGRQWLWKTQQQYNPSLPSDHNSSLPIDTLPLFSQPRTASFPFTLALVTSKILFFLSSLVRTKNRTFRDRVEFPPTFHQNLWLPSFIEVTVSVIEITSVFCAGVLAWLQHVAVCVLVPEINQGKRLSISELCLSGVYYTCVRSKLVLSLC